MNLMGDDPREQPWTCAVSLEALKALCDVTLDELSAMGPDGQRERLDAAFSDWTAPERLWALTLDRRRDLWRINNVASVEPMRAGVWVG